MGDREKGTLKERDLTPMFREDRVDSEAACCQFHGGIQEGMDLDMVKEKKRRKVGSESRAHSKKEDHKLKTSQSTTDSDGRVWPCELQSNGWFQ